jgi:pyruvate/oxaloacetate carboxyltransferase
VAQLQQAEHLTDKVLQTVPRVRLDAGVPPLVTPTSQIVGVQAVNCVIDQANGKPFYTSKSTQFVNLVKGSYGKTPFPVDPAFRLKIAGTRQETPYDTSTYRKQDNPLPQPRKLRCLHQGLQRSRQKRFQAQHCLHQWLHQK